MRPLLRLTALLVQLLILQGAFLGGGPACALAQRSAAATGHAHAGAHESARYAAHDADRQQPQQPQHAPAHCLAAGACVTAALGGRTVILPASVVVGGGACADDELGAPRSVSTAPEPPPPRA